MPQQVTMGAELQCSFGAMPSTLVVLPENRVLCEGKPAANIMDHQPLENILPFGMCSSLANPEVDTATAAALGVLTPMPCVPATITPWEPGAITVLLGGAPSLNNVSMCECTWGGIITIVDPATVKTQLPV